MFINLSFVLLPGGSLNQWSQNAKGLSTSCVSLHQPSAAIYKSQCFLTTHQCLEGLRFFTVSPGDFQAKHKIEISLIVMQSHSSRRGKGFASPSPPATLIGLPNKEIDWRWQRISKLILPSQAIVLTFSMVGYLLWVQRWDKERERSEIFLCCYKFQKLHLLPKVAKHQGLHKGQYTLGW